MMPRFDSVWPIRAVSLRRRKWQAIAISHPPPSAWPLIAAITGLGKRSILRMTVLPKRMNVSTFPPEIAEPRSAPAQKILSPAPVMMTERTLSSVSTESRAAFSSVTSCSLIAFAGGRFSVMTAKLSSRANCSVSYAIGADSFEKEGGDRVGGLREPVGALAEHPRGGELVHGAEQHLGGDLARQVAPDTPGRHALLQHALDDVEVGGDLVGGGAAEELLPLAQLDLHDLGQVGVVLDHLEVERDDLPDLGDRIPFAGDRLPHERHPLGHLLAEQRDEDLVLRLEVEVDGAARDARLARDVRDARVVIAVAREHADRGGDDLVRLVGITHGSD